MLGTRIWSSWMPSWSACTDEVVDVLVKAMYQPGQKSVFRLVMQAFGCCGEDEHGARSPHGAERGANSGAFR